MSSHQLHTALATTLLFPTHNSLNVDLTLPPPTASDSRFHSEGLCGENLDRLFNNLPYYITLSCGGDIINSSLCGVFWNPDIPSNLVSPWLQPLSELRRMQGVQDTPGRYAEVLALICARRVPALAFLSVGAAISGLTVKILEQVNSGQPPLERHAFAWTGVPQSFMDLAGEGKYYETYFSKAYIKRGDCWRLRKLPPIVEEDLHYGIGPFTPWEPPGYGLLKNCPLRVLVHKDCDRHAIAYEGSTWCFSNNGILEDFGKGAISPHLFQTHLIEEREPFHSLQSLNSEEASIDATITSFRWVLDNGDGRPPENAYKDPWLSYIHETDSEPEEMSDIDSSSDGEGPRENANSANSSIAMDTWLNRTHTAVEGKEIDNGVLTNAQAVGELLKGIPGP